MRERRIQVRHDIADLEELFPAMDDLTCLTTYAAWTREIRGATAPEAKQRRRIPVDADVGNLVAAAAQHRAELDRAQAVVHAGVLDDRLGDADLAVMHRPGAGHAVRQTLDAAPQMADRGLISFLAVHGRMVGKGQRRIVGVLRQRAFHVHRIDGAVIIVDPSGVAGGIGRMLRAADARGLFSSTVRRTAASVDATALR